VAKLVWLCAPQMKLTLKARINRFDAGTIRQALDQLAAKDSVRKEGDEFLVEAEMKGASAKELNRTLLSALRKARSGRRYVPSGLPATPPIGF